MDDFESKAEEVGLPVRSFLYTLDQIATLIGVTELALRRDYIYYVGRSIGRMHPDRMTARDISPKDQRDMPPEWRVADRELVRWMKRKGFKLMQRGYVTS